MAGWVYIMSNPSMPNLIKIGRSSREPLSARAAELSSSTGVPSDFKVEYQALIRDEFEGERLLHGVFAENRYRKEFFKDLSPAIVIFEVRRRLAVLHEDVFFKDEVELQLEIRAKEKLEREANEQETRRRNNDMLLRIRADEKVFNEYQVENRALEDKEKQKLQRMLDMSWWNPANLLLDAKTSHGGPFGFGARTYASGGIGNFDIYVGNLSWGKAHCHGTYRWKENGVIHVGQWKKGLRFGWGRVYGQGWSRAGFFVDDKLNGFGVSINGANVQVGIWKDNLPLFLRQ